MLTICITICVVALIICATICFYIMHNIGDAGDITKLEDINQLCDYIINKEVEAKEAEQFFNMDNYKHLVNEIYNLTIDYK